MKTSNKILIFSLGGVLALVIILAFVFRMNAERLSIISGDFGEYSKTFVVTSAGENVQRTYPLRPFKSMNIGGKYDVVIKRGNQQKVVVTTDLNVFTVLRVYVSGTELNIKTKEGVSLEGNHPIKVLIVAPDLNDMSLGGSVSLKVSDIESQQFTINIGGKSDCVLSGKTNYFEVNLGGLGHINAENLIANRVSINFAGKGDIRVHANKSLEINGLGSGSIQYDGNPTTIQNNVLGKINIHPIQ